MDLALSVEALWLIRGHVAFLRLHRAGVGGFCGLTPRKAERQARLIRLPLALLSASELIKKPSQLGACRTPLSSGTFPSVPYSGGRAGAAKSTQGHSNGVEKPAL